jgi:heme transport system ATP-binding protein
MNTVIELNDVAAAPWGKPLLRAINLSINAGEIIGILGPNGAGKTSLLNLLCGAIGPASGQCLFSGRPLSAWPIEQLARQMAVLPQHSSLNFPFSVEEVILLGRTPHSSGKKADREILEEVLQVTDTIDLRHRLYTQLSGGERQRVQLARSFAQIWRAQDGEPRLLLLDEPTSALDLAHQQQIMAHLSALANTGCAVITVLHDFNLAARWCQRCLILKGGQQHALGSPTEIYTPELFAAVFDVQVSVIPHPNKATPLVIQL